MLYRPACSEAATSVHHAFIMHSSCIHHAFIVPRKARTSKSWESSIDARMMGARESARRTESMRVSQGVVGSVSIELRAIA